MADNTTNDKTDIQLPEVLDAKLSKDREKDWILTIHTSDEQKLRIHPTQKDLKAFFAASKGKTLEETNALKKEMGEKYLPQALALPKEETEAESIDSVPNRSHEDRALDQFAESMIEKLETIQADWKKPWFTEGALSWPRNMNNRAYNGFNSLMLMMRAEKHGYKLPVWSTFDRVMNLNFSKDKEGHFVRATDKNGEPLPKVCVNKGEKSTPVFITTFSVINKETREKIPYDDYKQMDEDERMNYKVYPKLQVYNVFNIGQTNIEQARPELYKKFAEQEGINRPKQTGEQFEFAAVDSMIKDNKWICPIKPTYGDDAYYSISKREIVVPEKRQFVDGESFYSNLFHEMAHSTGAEGILNRIKPSSFGSSEYAKEELVAELSAALISQKYGLEKHVKEDSCAYLKNWLDSLKEDPSYIKFVLLDVKKASAMISQNIEKMQVELDNKKSEKDEQTETQAQTTQKSETKDNKAALAATTAVANEMKNLEEIGEFDVPEWSLSYLQNGDSEGLDEDEVELVDNFVKEKLSGKQFIMVVDWDKSKDFNNVPAFGPRNPYANPEFGEAPLQATKTYSVKFLEPVKLSQGQGEEENAAKLTPKEEDKEETKQVETKVEHHIHHSR